MARGSPSYNTDNSYFIETTIDKLGECFANLHKWIELEKTFN